MSGTEWFKNMVGFCVAMGVLVAFSAPGASVAEPISPGRLKPVPNAYEAVRDAVFTEELTYKSGDIVMKGYLAKPKMAQHDMPGILVVHEWWGHNDYARQRAEQLAGLGYIALAVDMYGDGKVANHPKDAGAFSAAVLGNLPVATARFKAALDVLHHTAGVDSTKIAAIGYCFGGGVVLAMAESGLPLSGVVSFHGGLSYPAPERPTDGKITAKMLILQGGSDAFVTPESVETLKKRLNSKHIANEWVSYPGVQHSFTNPKADEFAKKFNLPLAYDPDADKSSWAAMLKFFQDIFK